MGLFKFISDYLPYFEKKNIFIIRIDRNYVFGSFEITPIRLFTLLLSRYADYTVCTT